MGITNFPDKDIYTRQPKIYVYNNNTAVSGTYYTTVNSTGVRGKITKISLTCNTATSNSVLNIRITIDGVANSIGIPSQNYSVGYQHTSNSASTAYQAVQSIDYFCDIIFYSSCVIEFMQNGGTNLVLDGSIMYSTE